MYIDSVRWANCIDELRTKVVAEMYMQNIDNTTINAIAKAVDVISYDVESMFWYVNFVKYIQRYLIARDLTVERANYITGMLYDAVDVIIFGKNS